MPGAHGGNSDFAVCGHPNGNLASRTVDKPAFFETPCEVVTLQPRKILRERERSPGRSHYRGRLIEGRQLNVPQPISSGRQYDWTEKPKRPEAKQHTGKRESFPNQPCCQGQKVAQTDEKNPNHPKSQGIADASYNILNPPEGMPRPADASVAPRPNGTFETSSNVCSMVALGGRADVPQTSKKRRS